MIPMLLHYLTSEYTFIVFTCRLVLQQFSVLGVFTIATQFVTKVKCRPANVENNITLT